MYIQPLFNESHTADLHDHIQANPFGALTVLTSQGLEINHLPFELDPNAGSLGTLRAHVSRTNPVWQSLEASVTPAVVFQGPHAYVSPTWFPSRRTHGKVAPSWTYAVVHAYGDVCVEQSAEWLHDHLTALSNRQERERPDPWHLDEAPIQFTETMIKHIIGLEITNTRLIGKFQLGQQYREVDRQGVIEGMTREENPMSELVARMISKANTKT